jgi:hypothetical protein
MNTAEVVPIPVYYDFASALCWVAHRVVDRMQGQFEELGLQACWRPVDLTQLSGWRRGRPIEGVSRQNALRVSQELEVPLRLPGYWIDSRSASAVALGLANTLREASWRERVFSAVYEEGRLLEEPGEVERLGRDLELDVTSHLTPRTLQLLDEETEIARGRLVTSVPTFMLGDWPLSGIQEERTMRLLLERYAGKLGGDSS